MELRQLKYFAATIETRSLKKAAEQLCISQPAVSKSIKDLEQQLGSKLLVRGPRGIEPNEMGIVLYNHAKAVLAELNHAKKEILAHIGAETGSVTVGTTAVPAAHILPKTIAAFEAERPKVKLCVIGDVVETVFSLVQKGEVDFAICPVGPAFDHLGLEQEFLFEAPVAVLCHAKHPLLSRSSLSCADLLNSTWITSLAGTRPALNLSLAFEAEELPLPDHLIRSDSQLLTRSLLLESDCITLAPLPLYHRELSLGQLAKLDVKLQWPKSINYGIMYRRHSFITPAMETFWAVLRQSCGKDAKPSPPTG